MATRDRQGMTGRQGLAICQNAETFRLETFYNSLNYVVETPGNNFGEIVLHNASGF
ncbi:MAG: hypothetical protein NTV31_05230 [Bacteroidia bacterium]|nr:hypothetical protein [Bacteroidia bacterium]